MNILWVSAAGGAAAQPSAERTASLPRESGETCTVTARAAGAITLRCPGGTESQCTTAGLADVVPGAPVEQIAVCGDGGSGGEDAIVVLREDGAPLGGGFVGSSATVAVLDVISDDADELLVRTSTRNLNGEEGDRFEAQHVYLLKWRGSVLVRVYHSAVSHHALDTGAVESRRVEVALSGDPTITETVLSSRARRAPRPTVVAWNPASFRFEPVRARPSGTGVPSEGRPFPPLIARHQLRVEGVEGYPPSMCTLVGAADQVTLTCDNSGDGGNQTPCMVVAVADVAPEPGVERVLACGDFSGFTNDGMGGRLLVLVAADLRPLWTYSGGNGVTARAVDLVAGGGQAELLVEDSAMCPMENCDASEPASWRVMRWRDSALALVLAVDASTADRVALEIDPVDGMTVFAERRAARGRRAATTRYVWNETALRFEPRRVGQRNR